ncbi:1310_t:CDS:1, partial [Paraglomus occultum]
ITTGDIPFRVVTYGEAKEYETWINAVKIIRKELDSVVDVDTHVKAEQFKTELTPQPINDIITSYRI